MQEKKHKKRKSEFRNGIPHKNIKITMIFLQKSDKKTSNIKAPRPIHFYFHFLKIEEKKRCAKQYRPKEKSRKIMIFAKKCRKS